jgi:hypothetical protein
LPEDITVKLIDEAQYFAGGIDLPAGRYRLAYVDGCFSYGQPITTYGWTVHALKAAGFGCWLIDGNGMALMPTPGTDGITRVRCFRDLRQVRSRQLQSGSARLRLCRREAGCRAKWRHGVCRVRRHGRQ